MRNLRAWLFLTLTLTLSCGGRSELASSFQSETDGGAASIGGTPITGAGRGGNVAATGGGFVMGGAPGAAGAFVTAGTAGVGTGGAAGAGQMCTLSVSDCRTADQVECQNPLCAGSTVLFDRITSFDHAHVVDVTTSTEGYVAVAGTFRGKLLVVDRNEERIHSAVQPSVGRDAFVALLDSRGEVFWVVGYGGDGDQLATGLDFSPEGDVIVQGKNVDQGFALKLDRNGNLRWQSSFEGGELAPGQVVIDNNGVVTLSGSFSDRLVFDGSAVYSSGLSPYLLRMYDDGSLITAQGIELDSWSRVSSHRLVVDDEDKLILAGWGERQQTLASFALKLTPETGQVIYQHEFSADFLRLNALTVDREMRVTFGGELDGTLELSGAQLEAAPGQRQVWLAQLDRDGAVRWLRRYEQPDLQLQALTVDGLGNLALLGRTPDSLYVQKLRPSGAPVWLRQFPVSFPAELAIAADNDRNLWLSGAFAGPLDHGDGISTALGNVDGFVLKVGP